MSISSVTIVGANGTLGSEVLRALVSSGTFSVSVLRRESSSSPGYGGAVKILEVSDNFAVDDLATALQGQDAVVACFPLRNLDDHLHLVEASASAGVKRFIPADFGSCDASSPRAQELLKLYRDKDSVRKKAEELAVNYPDFSWTSLVCGHFFDWGLLHGFLHFDLKNHKADILDGGIHKASLSTLSRIAEGVIKVLQREESTKNRVLFIQSFCVTQVDILRSLEKASGIKWTVRELESEPYMKEVKVKVDAGDREAVEDLVYALGAIDGNWEEKDEFAMGELGLVDENLDDVVTRVFNSQK
jgi:hypothetical protein